jgi:tetratricopeptide (TPR) repeat protein
MNRCSRAFWAVLGLVLLGLVHPSPARADRSCDNRVARLVSAQGRVEQRRAGEASWSSSRRDTTFCPGDALRTGADSRATLLLPNETLLRLDQLTTLILPEAEAQETGILVNLLRGIGYFFSRTPKKLEIKAPFVNAAIEGTEFLVSADPKESSVLVLEGVVRASNAKGSLRLTSGEGAIAGPGEVPRRILVADPRDAVQWALYYPPVIGFGTQYPDLPIGADRAIAAFERGNIDGALAALNRVPERERTPDFYGLRASILLYVGRVEKSRADIARALKLDPAYAGALALQSIIALVRNDPEAAMRFAQRGAKARGAEGAASQIALSYVYQSRFDLDGALEHARTATELAPHNPLGWARLAEIDLALRKLDPARQAAEKATSLNPRISRIQTTLGFAQLIRFDTTEAIASFNRAIELDQADPLPHLGLGLALIRKNDLEEGRRQIEIAASLDPNNSLIRSYLGKAYYEEKRNPLDGRQFDLAKKLDPRDPTPWLYDAIRKQTLNRPAEALADLDKSIELNDDRAVFRSKLELDQDLATRTTDLARIYQNLGFEDLGFLEGWRSLELDPGNFSAHRFLADSYADMPRHEIARQSELLQSQLRQPLVIHPIQTRIGSLGTFIPLNIGPRNPALNEYTPLFTHDGPALEVDGLVGGNNTWGDEILASAIAGKASFSAGQFHYQTDGFRENADQTQDSLVAFAQLAVTPFTNIQVEARRGEIERGDLRVYIDPDDYDPIRREAIKEDIFRVGFLHDFSARSNLIGSYWHQRSDDNFDYAPGEAYYSSAEGDQVELQHLYRIGSSYLRTGGSYYKGKLNDTNIAEGEPEQLLEDQTYAGLYAYTNIRRPENLTLTLGLGMQSSQAALVDSKQWNPKLGLVWNAGESHQTTVRLAAFRTLKRAITADQTLEPTTIAGFNQFFDDPEGTDAWRYGLGLDQKFNERLFGGLEYTRRDLTVPGLVFASAGPLLSEPPQSEPPSGPPSGPPESAAPPPPPPPPSEPTFAEGNLQERLGRAYLYWLPHKWWSFSLELSREQYEREDGFTGPEKIKDLTTDGVMLGANFFHPSGFFANLIASYINQDGTFGIGPPLDELVDDGDSFWVVDLALGYRLPKRFGLISIGVRNLFDQDFRYQDTDFEHPRFVTDRFAFARAALSF